MAAGTNGTVHLDEGSFERAVSTGVALIDFWAPWCPPCRILGPTVDSVAAHFSGRAMVGKVDVDGSPGLAAQYGIQSIPTLLFFKDGELQDRLVGVVPAGVLSTRLEQLLEQP